MIETKRLVLYPLNREQLENYLDREDLFSSEVGPASRVILTPLLRKAIQMKLSRMDQVSQEDIPWITYWLIKVKPE